MKNSNTTWQAVDRDLGNPITKEELIEAIKNITSDSNTGKHISRHLKNSNEVGSKINFETLEELKNAIIEKIKQIPEPEFKKRGITIDFGKNIGITSVISEEELKKLKQKNKDIKVGVLNDGARTGTNGVYMKEGGIETSKITVIFDKDERTNYETVVRTIFSGENAPPLPLATYTRNFLIEAQKLLLDINNKEKLGNFLKFTNFFVNVVNEKDQELRNIHGKLFEKLQNKEEIKEEEIYKLVTAIAKKYELDNGSVYKLEDIKNDNFWNKHYFITNNKNIVISEKDLYDKLTIAKNLVDFAELKSKGILNLKTIGQVFKSVIDRTRKIVEDLKEKVKEEINYNPSM